MWSRDRLGMSKPFYRKEDRRIVAVLLPVAIMLVGLAVYRTRLSTDVRPAFGPGSLRYLAPTVRAEHIRRHDGRQFLWASGRLEPGSEETDWFDLTGSPLPLEKFEHGIGRDEIQSIDDPVFVKPDDPRLLAYWSERGVGNPDDLLVIGYVHGGVARAYPKLLLNGRELVNDTVGGKPVTVGW